MARKPTAQQIDLYLRQRKSPLAGFGSKFIQVGQKYGIDPLLLVAISGAESSFGKEVKGGTFNPFGWGPHRPMGSWDNAIETVGRGLRKGYYDEGRDTPAEIAGKWAPIGAGNDPTNLNSNWTKNVSKFLDELGGGQAGPAPAGRGTVPTPAPRDSPVPQRSGLSDATRNLIFGDDPEFANTLTRLASRRAAPTGTPVRQARGKTPTPALDQIKGEFGPQAMLAIIKQAQQMGLAVRENPYVDPVDPVHTKNSWHYQTFPGQYGGKKLGRGADISGNPKSMAQLFGWIRKNYPGIEEAIYDPIGSIFSGQFKPGAYGGHKDHVHVGF
jgi:hypothetical protein